MRNTRTFTVLQETGGGRRSAFRNGLGVPEYNSGLHAGRGAANLASWVSNAATAGTRKERASTQPRYITCCRNRTHISSANGTQLLDAVTPQATCYRAHAMLHKLLAHA